MQCIDDFYFMRCGAVCSVLSEQERDCLSTIEQYGAKKQSALLLLHGFASSPAVYRMLTPKLKMYDALVCPLLPGHGESVEAFSRVKAVDWLLAVEKACEVLCQEYQHVDVMGLSLGGVLAWHLSQRFKLHHLYLLAPAFRLSLNIHFAQKAAALCLQLGFRSVQNRAGNIVAHEACELAYRQLPLTTILELFSLIEDTQIKASPSCPCDLFLGAHDAVIDSQYIGQQFSLMQQVRVHYLKHSAHVLPLDNDHQEIVNTIKQHL